MHRLAVLTVTTVLGLGVLAGCGDAETTAGSSTQSTTRSGTDPATSAPTTGATGSATPGAPSGTVIAVTFSGDTVTPNGDRVEVPVGEPVELAITADAPGEIHVHSSPEQELEYPAGESTVTIAPIQRPGIVEVESHSLDELVVQLQVQ